MRTLLMTLCMILTVFSACALEDGIYRDKAPGFGGDVIVTVTIRGGSIDSLTTENTGGDKSEYYLKAENALREAILAVNGTEGVDAVAGATGTSESILSAMQGILEQAAYTGTQNAAPLGGAGSVKEPTMTAWPHPTV